jgi:hypothetical protein
MTDHDDEAQLLTPPDGQCYTLPMPLVERYRVGAAAAATLARLTPAEFRALSATRLIVRLGDDYYDLPRTLVAAHRVAAQRRTVMFRCSVCRFLVELDDVELGSQAGRCICLGCYGRLTDTRRSLPPDLDRALAVVLAEVELPAR